MTEPNRRLEGQTLLVIGGSSGVGLETAREARREGAAVILTGRDAARAHAVGLELEASIAAFDATDFARLDRFFAALRPRLVDHVLLTGPHRSDQALADMNVDDARRDVEAHLLLPLRVAQLAATTMRPGGTVLFTGCIGGPSAARPFRSAVTQALSTLIRTLASELSPVRVNVIVPGLASSAPSSDIRIERPDANHDLPGTTPLPPSSGPAEAAALAIDLMTNVAITGATFVVEGR